MRTSTRNSACMDDDSTMPVLYCIVTLTLLLYISDLYMYIYIYIYIYIMSQRVCVICYFISHAISDVRCLAAVCHHGVVNLSVVTGAGGYIHYRRVVYMYYSDNEA